MYNQQIVLAAYVQVHQLYDNDVLQRRLSRLYQGACDLVKKMPTYAHAPSQI